MAIDKQETGESIHAPASRTAPCPCGSGRRYKDCHGSLLRTAATTDTGARAHQLALQALNAQQQQDLKQARALYEQALALSPDHDDALHMLGVVHYDQGDAAAAAPLILRALDLTEWKIPALRNNLGLVLAKLSGRGSLELGLNNKGRDYRARRAAAASLPVIESVNVHLPTVSVVVPSYNHAPYLRAALESIYAQTYRQIELVVIDDGSTDGSAEIARTSLQSCPFPHRLITRENRGAHATLNEAIALTTGAYINPLNSDDLFAPERLALLVNALQAQGTNLAFSSVAFIDAQSRIIDPFDDARVYSLMCRQSNVSFCETVGHAFLTDNVAVTTGNLLFSRSLFDSLGGFREFRYNHDWDFCLRALWHAEPVHVDEPLYRYRFHGANTILESAERNRIEALTVHGEYLTRALDESNEGAEFTPNIARWGERFVTFVLASGLSGALSPNWFRAYATSLIARAPQANAIST